MCRIMSQVREGRAQCDSIAEAEILWCVQWSYDVMIKFENEKQSMAAGTPGCPYNSSLENGSRAEGWDTDRGNGSAMLKYYLTSLACPKENTTHPPASHCLRNSSVRERHQTLHRFGIINGSWGKPNLKVTWVKEMITWPVWPLANLCTAVLGFPWII